MKKSIKFKSIPLYKREDILKAIEKEGLVREAWGNKTDFCIFVFTSGMEKEDIWKEFPTPLHGFERAHWNSRCIEPATYFLIEGYKGNLNRLSYEIEYPHGEMLIPDDM